LTALNLIFLGTAGAGKSLLTANFGKWMEERGMRPAYINLDPGCESTPYRPDFDIRRHFTLSELMRREGLGPNGAMIRACELLEEGTEGFAREINSLEGDFRLIDTPGQMEVFLFHGGPEMARLVEGLTVCIFLVDARLVLQPFGGAFTRLLGISVGLRMGVPTLSILNKVDLVEREVLEKAMETPGPAEGVLSDLTSSISELLLPFRPPVRRVWVSAARGEGFQELYDLIHETRCACGDLT
jgi:GTPase SAR1 family protein